MRRGLKIALLSLGVVLGYGSALCHLGCALWWHEEQFAERVAEKCRAPRGEAPPAPSWHP